MGNVRIDKFGFLRHNGKIIGWTIVDFIWAVRGWRRPTHGN